MTGAQTISRHHHSANMGPLLLLCNPSAALSPPPPPAQPPSPRAAAAAAAPPVLRASPAGRKLVSAALSGALSLGLLFSPPSIAAESSLARTTKSGPSVEYCREEEAKEDDGAGAVPERVTNERIVEEAWDIVNESFLGTGRRRWSPEAWQANSLSLSLNANFHWSFGFSFFPSRFFGGRLSRCVCFICSGRRKTY